MSEYKNFQLRQLGIRDKKGKGKPLTEEFPGIDPQDYLQEPTDREKMLSPTAIATPVIGLSVRGSSTGGFPSGIDQTGIPSNTPTGRLGGYEPISTDRPNSLIADKTPKNSDITTSEPVLQQDPKTDETPHPHQIQSDAGEPPQKLTGAEVDGNGPANTESPQNDEAPGNGEIDIDVAEKETPDAEPDDDSPASKLNETFKRHRKLMKEKLGLKEDNEDPKWMQKSSEKSQKKGTEGDLHKALKVPKDEKISVERLNSIQSRLHKKAENGKLSPSEHHLSKMVNMALRYREANKK
jgi:hypothetical protein